MYISKVQSQQINPYYRQKNVCQSRNNVAFGSAPKTIAEIINSQMVTNDEAVRYILKLSEKIKLLNHILGKNDKTARPVRVKLDDADVFLSVDKTSKGNVKVNLYSDTNSPLYEYSFEKSAYLPSSEKYLNRQRLDIVLSNTDGRMCNGYLSTVSGEMIFERNTKSGQRKAVGDRFYLNPNLYECSNRESFPAQWYGYDKASNIVSTVFYNLFAKLSKVKPDIKLM